jgi:recombinational DNA repair ATPase RecF
VIFIDQLEITEFRGIRKLSVDFKRKNFGIAGPNGTGKSGIVDAIEFALTGNITRLGGEGTADISVTAHAPHVDSAKKPEKAVVRLTAYVPASGKTIVIERSVRASAVPILAPDTPTTRDLIAKCEAHPEFALSRREIIKYILTPAGQRSKDVQILLRLDFIEKVRMSLQRIANDTKKESARAQTEDARARQEFYQYVGLEKPKTSDVLAAVNERRTVLKLAPLADITNETLFKDGVVGGGAAEPKATLSKTEALADIEGYAVYSKGLESEDFKTSIAKVLQLLSNLTADPAALRGLRQKILVEQGIALLDEEACPLCDLAWDSDELRAHLEGKAKKATAAIALLAVLGDAAAPIVAYLENCSFAAQKLVRDCEKAEPKINAADLANFAAHCDADRAVLERIDSDPSAFADVTTVLGTLAQGVPPAWTSVVTRLKAYVEALPEPSKEDAAKEFLIVAQEKYHHCRRSKVDFDAALARADTAAKVFQQYGVVSTSVLEEIYDSVQKDFTTFYRYINRDDEDEFEGRLTPSVGKLAFDVDFYGRGKFPPGAYHSEGHQDAMGLCLYLALMKHTLGDGFTLAVLDDVLMSVDAGHRREVCSLLKTHFPKTQFILTTHDPVWLQFMRAEELIKGSISFGSWTVETGPQVWDEGDVWKQIEGKLAKSDVPGAAATLRRYLEFIATMLADNLRARVEYHANGQYDLSDLWPAVVKAWRERLREARESAVSWGSDTTTIDALWTEASQRIADTKSDEWMINKAVHFNAWANLQPKEFAVLAAAFQALLKSMQCKNAPCGEFLRVLPVKGNRELLRCGCGQSNLNLMVK